MLSCNQPANTGKKIQKNELNSSEEGGQLYDERYFLCVAEAIA